MKKITKYITLVAFVFVFGLTALNAAQVSVADIKEYSTATVGDTQYENTVYIIGDHAYVGYITFADVINAVKEMALNGTLTDDFNIYYKDNEGTFTNLETGENVVVTDDTVFELVSIDRVETAAAEDAAQEEDVTSTVSSSNSSTKTLTFGVVTKITGISKVNAEVPGMDEAFASIHTYNMNTLSLDYEEETLTLTETSMLGYYNNGWADGKWFGLLIETNNAITANNYQKYEIILNGFNGDEYPVTYTYTIEPEDIEEGSTNVGGSKYEFVMWLRAPYADEISSITFKEYAENAHETLLNTQTINVEYDAVNSLGMGNETYPFEYEVVQNIEGNPVKVAEIPAVRMECSDFDSLSSTCNVDWTYNHEFIDYELYTDEPLTEENLGELFIVDITSPVGEDPETHEIEYYTGQTYCEVLSFTYHDDQLNEDVTDYYLSCVSPVIIESVNNDIVLPEYNVAQEYNVTSVESATFDAETNTIDVVFNRTLANVEAGNGVTAKWYALVLKFDDKGVMPYYYYDGEDNFSIYANNYGIEPSDIEDAYRHVEGAGLYDYGYVVIWLSAEETDLEEGKTINFFTDDDQIVFPLTIKSTYNEEENVYLSLEGASTINPQNFNDGDAFLDELIANSEGLSASVEDNTVTISYDKPFISYNNGFRDDEWFGVILDLGVDPSLIEVTGDSSTELSFPMYSIDAVDRDAAQVERLAGENYTDTSFVVWLRTSKFNGNALTLTFEQVNNEYNSQDSIEITFMLEDAIEPLTLQNVVVADSDPAVMGSYALLHANNQDAMDVKLNTEGNIVFGVKEGKTLASYNNGYATGDWYAILVDFGIDPARLVSSSTPCSALTGTEEGEDQACGYSIEDIDYLTANNHGAQTPTEFVMWLRADTESRDITFYDPYTKTAYSFNIATQFGIISARAEAIVDEYYNKAAYKYYMPTRIATWTGSEWSYDDEHSLDNDTYYVEVGKLSQGNTFTTVTIGENEYTNGYAYVSVGNASYIYAPAWKVVEVNGENYLYVGVPYLITNAMPGTSIEITAGEDEINYQVNSTVSNSELTVVADTAGLGCYAGSICSFEKNLDGSFTFRTSSPKSYFGVYLDENSVHLPSNTVVYRMDQNGSVGLTKGESNGLNYGAYPHWLNENSFTLDNVYTGAEYDELTESYNYDLNYTLAVPSKGVVNILVHVQEVVDAE